MSSLSWLETLGLQIIVPENALACQRCQIALSISGNSVRRHLEDVHGLGLPHWQIQVQRLALLPLVDISKLCAR